MSVRRLLDDWVREGVLDAEAARRIEAFEKGRSSRSDRTTSVFTRIAGLSIALGICVWVAANWDRFGSLIKLGGALVVATTVAVVAQRAHRRHPPPVLDAILIVFIGVMLGSLALIGQVFQTTAPARILYGTWWLLSVPALAWMRTTFGAVIVLVITYLAAGSWAIYLIAMYFDVNLWSLHALWALGLLVILAHLVVSQWPGFKSARPRLAYVCGTVGWATLACMSALLMRYAAFRGSHEFGVAAPKELATWRIVGMPSVVGATLVGVFVLRRIRSWEPRNVPTGVVVWLVSCGASLLTVAFLPEVPDVVRWLCCLAVLVVYTWAANAIDNMPAFYAACGAIVLCVLVQVFSTWEAAFSRGVSLILFGAVVLFALHLIRRIRTRRTHDSGSHL